ncbi:MULTISPECIES: L,D-transpeptidase family protein [unclassified Kribbella]|uniref:L,D-transpeptidase family protein n=1 Tax=unclassified Kribbella TaxID=2644121 RepID=UPI00340AD968
MRGLIVRKLVTGLVAGAAIAALLSSGSLATARPAATTDLKTVPFEVSGELPIYPKALWKNGSTGTNVRKVEARLVQLKLLEKRYLDDEFGTMTRSAVKKFQKSKGVPELGYVDQNTWNKLAAVTHEPTQTELYPPAPVVNGKKLDARCATGVVLCIDKSTRKLRYVVDGVVKMQLDVRFGAVKTATREGSFTVGWKSRNHVSKLYDSPMPFAMFFSGGQAVHYSSDFAARGYNGASHGCVNVRDLGKIKLLFDQIKVGDKVIVYRS